MLRSRPDPKRVAVLFVALTIVLTWPIALHPASTMLPLGPDGDLFIWTLAWDAHAFLHQPLSIFDANIYHPLRHTLAYSENLIGSAFFAAPVIWLTGNPVLAFNLVALLSCALCGVGAVVLARRAGLAPGGAVICGLVFAFSTPRFFRTGQLHLAAVQWVPFALASLHAYLDEGRKWHLRLAAALFSLQALSSGHGAAFLLVAMAGLVVWRVFRSDAVAPIRRVRDLGVTGALLLAPSVLVYLPYRAVQHEMGLKRALENWAVTPVSFIASPTHVQSFLLSLAPGAHVMEEASAFLFPGYLPLLLAAAALVFRPRDMERVTSSGGRGRLLRISAVTLEVAAGLLLALAVALTIIGPTRLRVGSTIVFSSRNAWRPWLLLACAATARLALLRRVPLDPAGRLSRAASRFRARRTQSRARGGSVTFYGLLALVSVWLSIGPPLGLWPLVYWLPGMSFIRVPSRFTILAVLGLAIVAGAGFDRLAGRFAPRRSATFAAIVGFLLVVEFAAIPFAVVPYRADAPLADRWLATRPVPFAVAEVPLPDPMNAGAFERCQTQFMLHSTAHWQKTVHGYSGWRAPLHEQLYLQMRNFPDEASLRGLAALGVTYVVVHTELYPPGEWPQVQARIDGYGAQLQLEHVAGSGRVYSLREAAAK
jgi:hypothetical protein